MGRPAERLEVRVWRAGRSLHPGLSATRAEELESERAGAVLEFERSLSSEDRGQLEAWLEDAATPLELWRATVRCVVFLEAYELAPLLATALAPDAPPGRAASARSALHELYGRWFRAPDEVSPYLETVRRGPGTRLFVESLLAQEAQARARIFGEVDRRATVPGAWVEDPDPEVRAEAARILARSQVPEGEGAGPLLTLVAHLEGEEDARAFHEILSACLTRLEHVDVDHSSSLRLRALLVDLVRSGDGARALSLAQALARMTWRSSGARDLGHVFTALDSLGVLGRSLAAADRRRGVNDPDPLSAVLVATRQLALVAKAGGLGPELRVTSAQQGLLELLVDPGQDVAIRVGAANVLGLQGRLECVPTLGEVLFDPGVQGAVKYALLGALAELVPELGSDAPGVERIARALVEQTAAADVDLRRRALALLAEPALEPVLRGLDSTFLAERLVVESNREARLRLLGLIGRFGRPEMGAVLLETPPFEGLCGDPALLDELVGVFRTLVGDDEAARFELAERLVSAQGEATRLARLRHALALVAGLSEAHAFALTAPQHAAVCAWVWTALGAGVTPREISGEDPGFLRRLVEAHLPRSHTSVEMGSALGAFESAQLTAVLRAEACLLGLDGPVGSKSEVEAAFHASFERAATPAQQWLALRDRARFRAGANEGVKALADYRRLLAAGPGADELLAISDLRVAHGLLERLDLTAGSGARATAEESCLLLSRIVSRPEWRAEPAAVRLKDIHEWVESSLADGRPTSLVRVESALTGLPDAPAASLPDPDPAPIWQGLTREPDWLRELWSLRSQVRSQLEATTRG